MHFITNGFKHFSKTNSSDLRQSVPLSVPNYRVACMDLCKSTEPYLCGPILYFDHNSYVMLTTVFPYKQNLKRKCHRPISSRNIKEQYRGFCFFLPENLFQLTQYRVVPISCAILATAPSNGNILNTCKTFKADLTPL